MIRTFGGGLSRLSQGKTDEYYTLSISPSLKGNEWRLSVTGDKVEGRSDGWEDC
jgi:hypothetical protein